MKVLSPAQIRALDAYTILTEPISSIDLMERASNVFVGWFMEQFPEAEKTPVKVFCGIGNNGGDGLAVARLLNQKHYEVVVYLCNITRNRSKDCETNLKRIPRNRGLPVYEIKQQDTFPAIEPSAIIIDAIFGSGLNRPITAYWADLVQFINALPNEKVAIDIPSGLFAEEHTMSTCIQATFTLSFEVPKLAFFFPENQQKLGNWVIESIGLNQDFIMETESSNFFTTKKVIQSLSRKRQKFDHKGTYGHALLVLGSYGKIGAAILATRACLRSGAGLVTTHIPKCAYEIMQITCPEAMTSVDASEQYVSDVFEVDRYKAIGIGCGLGQAKPTARALFELLTRYREPMVIDADALNILAKAPEYLEQIPENSILTPHPKEFERLFGKTANDFERNDLQRSQARALNCIIILKGANTCIASPDGTCYFNSTGNPGMATGGSGDVLTGILVGLLAQGYAAKDAAILGVYLHGLAGDLGAVCIGQESLIAGDLIQYIGQAYKELAN